MAYVWAGVVLAIPAFLLLAAGVFDHNVAARRPPGLVVAPFYPGGVWAIAADLSVGAIVISVTALAIHGSVLRRTGFASGRSLVAVTLAITGWAPYLGFHLLALSGGASFVVTLVVLRFAARPASSTETNRWPLRPLAALGVVAAVLVCSYAAFHPFREVSLGSFSTSRGETGTTVGISNDGPADLVVLGADVPVTTGRFPIERRPIVGLVIRRHEGVTLLVSRAACAAGLIHVRYRMLGRSWTQPLLVPANCSYDSRSS